MMIERDANRAAAKIKKGSLKTLLIIILFLYTDSLCENFLVIVNNNEVHLISLFFLFGFLILQIIFAPLQSGFSDFYGRKKSLIISLGVSVCSILFIYAYVSQVLTAISVLVFATTIKGVWGNTMPISFAAIADTQDGDYRASFALASGTYALAFITLIGIRKFSFGENALAYIVGGGLCISMLACIFRFKDSQDKIAHFPYQNSPKFEHKLFDRILTIGKREIILIKKEFSLSLNKRALLSYILWEMSMYSILVSEVDLHRGEEHNFVLSVTIGYLFGVAILRFNKIKKISDDILLSIGYYVSFFSLIPYFFLYVFIGNNGYLLGTCYFFHAIGNALLSSTIITVLVKGRSFRDQGKLLGLFESADTVALLISTAVVMVLIHFKISAFYVVFSFLSFAASWVFYSRLIADSKKQEAA